METMTVDISIVCANYNNGRFLEAFIQSVRNAQAQPRELIIVDDGSDDQSRSILEKNKHLPFLRSVFFEKNRGFAHALNAGIEQANGKYIMRADPDDILHPNKIREHWEFLEEHTDLAGIGCNVAYFRDSPDKCVFRSSFPLSPEAVEKAYRDGEHGMQHPTVIIRSEVFKRYTYRQDTVPAEDYDIFARMVKDGHRFANLPHVLYFMRIHPDSASSRIKPETIQKTFALRDNLFSMRTTQLFRWRYYRHIRAYRNFLLETNRLFASLHLLKSAVYFPEKVIKRLLR